MHYSDQEIRIARIVICSLVVDYESWDLSDDRARHKVSGISVVMFGRSGTEIHDSREILHGRVAVEIDGVLDSAIRMAFQCASKFELGKCYGSERRLKIEGKGDALVSILSESLCTHLADGGEASDAKGEESDDG